jgi:site-specific DNA recombinase
MRAGIYARVSTTEQAREGTSLESQVRQCRAFVNSKGWEVVGEFVDEGVSGSLDSRPQLDRMFQAVRAGDLDVVVVAKLDRFSRSLRHLVNAVPELEEAGVAFVSVAESIDGTTATCRLFRSVPTHRRGRGMDGWTASLWLSSLEGGPSHRIGTR